MSRVLPILFNTEMVQAILDGRKTVTRRVIKLPKYVKPDEHGTYTLYAEDTAYFNQTMEQVFDYIKHPYYVGDILYVRETWQECCRNTIQSPITHDKYCYKASLDSPMYGCIEECGQICNWHPSIHMPKEAARIWLRVTDVRVERLQEITDEQARKEGATGLTTAEYGNIFSTRDDFKHIWNFTISESEFFKYGWHKNPWVWVIEFERCEKSK